MSDNPVVKIDNVLNIGGLSKPATLLIEKISKAIGGVFKPWQIVRVAKAEAEAERIRQESKIEITEMHKRAMHRFLAEEAKKQFNIEEITRRALPLLEDKSSPESVDDDWITNFFDKCRLISDDDMQRLWSKILAGEANAPGTFSKRTVNLLGDLDKRDAEIFTLLCGFGWRFGSSIFPLIFDHQNDIYNRHQVNFGNLAHMSSLGLVRFESVVPFSLQHLPKVISIDYYGRSVLLTFPADFGNKLTLGFVMLTKAGEDLAPVCGATPVDGFYDYVYDRWAKKGLVAPRDGAHGGSKEA